MLWIAFLLAFGVTCIKQVNLFQDAIDDDTTIANITGQGNVQKQPILSPAFIEVVENSSLQMNCYAPNNTTLTTWGTLNQTGTFSHLYFFNEGSCKTDGDLADSNYFETNCYRNGTFKVTIKRVNSSNHGQEWYCLQNYKRSNTAYITVKVPIRFLTIYNGDVLNTIENMKATLTCETSEGRPAANITWTKISIKGIKTYLTHDIVYTTSRKETHTERNLTIVKSNIEIDPIREDNGTRIICRATNIKSYEVTEEITIYVQYPPSKPLFFVDGRQVNDSINLIYGTNLSVRCKSVSYPYPTYIWSSESNSEVVGEYLNISKRVDIGTWQCTATNNMTLPDKTLTGNISAKLEVHLCYPSNIKMFYVVEHTEGDVIEVTENETFIFKCSVDRHQDSEIVLSFKEQELRRNVSTKTLDHNHRVTSCLDSGVYMCEAKTKCQSKPSFKQLKVSVRCTPIVFPRFDLKTNISSVQHAIITFQFKTIAYPTPDFFWYQQSGSSWNSLKSSNKYIINKVDNYSNLTVINITDEDYGKYKLEIKNDVGSLEQFYFLEGNESNSLTETSMHDLLYVICSCGGVIVIVSVFVATWFSRKRWLEQKHAGKVFYQNVPLSAHETSTTYQNVPFCTAQTAVSRDRPTRNEEVNASREITEKPQGTTVSQNEEELELGLDETFSEPTEYYNILKIIKRIEKIKINELYEYVLCRTDESFSVDFQKIPTGFQMPCSSARKPENIALNRYKGILPYDHTRVCIDGLPDFFINASYIDGYNRPKEYIACLGPTATTHDNFKTFWKMVWHEKSELIVMVTNLNEPSGIKCEQYWPDLSQDERYGDILVSCQKVEMFAEYTIRSFKVTRTTHADTFCRRLMQLHYTAWPDKKTPEDVTSLLEFRRTLLDIRTTVNGPVVIHCSAGIGRTGVFIAIDKLIMEGKNEGTVNVVACITRMREQRVKMVQSCEQYRFIFQALVYALNFDFGPIPTESLTDHNENIFDDEFFDRQYKEMKLSLERESKEQIDSRAKNKSYKDKNRHGADIPGSTNRVYLYLNRNCEDSDYINAVFINSHICKDHFIMAQSPLPGTESDFLTMIYQENCFCVVSMEDCNDHGMKIGKYLLEGEVSLDIGSFTVSCVINDSKPQYTVRKVTIRNKDEFSTGERDFYHFQYNNWSAENDIPLKAKEFVEFVKDVQEYAILGDEYSHVLVHCLKANERSGLFCAIAIIREKLLFDEQVSVLNTLRHLRTRRPSAITSMEQLKFCYKAAEVIAKRQNEGIYINN